MVFNSSGMKKVKIFHLSNGLVKKVQEFHSLSWLVASEVYLLKENYLPNLSSGFFPPPMNSEAVFLSDLYQ